MTLPNYKPFFNEWLARTFDLTPVQKHGIWFKRDDLFSPDGLHNGSKFRQLIWLFNRAANPYPYDYPGVVSGAVTGSPQLPMVAACARFYGIRCVQFTGGRKNMALSGERLGAETILVNPGYSATLNAKAREYAAEHGFLHIETNITVSDESSIEPFHRRGAQQVQNIPDHIHTLIVPAGSRNSVTSILYGLHLYQKQIDKVILMNIAPSLEKHDKWMRDRLAICGVKEFKYEIETHDLVGSGYTSYDELMPYRLGSIEFHPRYEGKIWSYIGHNLATFQRYITESTLFWIVGSEPKTEAPATIDSATKPSTSETPPLFVAPL